MDGKCPDRQWESVGAARASTVYTA